MQQTQPSPYLIRATAVAALATLLLALLLLFTYPAEAGLTEGFRTPVLAFEFARTAADLEFLTGNSDSAANHRAAMDKGQYIDMLFPFAYAGLLALLLLGLARQGITSAWLGLAFALSIIPSDIRENLLMLEISAALANDQAVTALLPTMHIATWFKWWGLAITAGFLAFAYLRRRHWFAAGLSALACAAIVLSWISDASPMVIETMALLLSLFYLFFAFQAFWALKQASSATTLRERTPTSIL